MFLFPWRHARPRRLALAGLLLLGVALPQSVYETVRDQARWTRAGELSALSAAVELSEDEQADLTWRKERVERHAGVVDTEERNAELAARRGATSTSGSMPRPLCGLFARFGRAELMGIVAVIWVAQIAVSGPWLRRFRFGPLEWLWRSLTYGERQPMRRRAAGSADQASSGRVAT